MNMTDLFEYPLMVNRVIINQVKYLGESASSDGSYRFRTKDRRERDATKGYSRSTRARNYEGKETKSSKRKAFVTRPR